MSGWLRGLLGLEDWEVPAGAESRWELSGLPSGVELALGVLLVAAALFLVVLLYRRETALRPIQKVVLTGLRLAALAIVVLMLLNPRLLTEIRLTHPGKTIILADASASMAERDEFDGDERDRIEAATGLDLADRPTRIELAVAALGKGRVLERLSEHNRLDLHSFAGDVKALAKLEGPENVPPTGDSTDLGAALRAVLDSPGRQPIAAVVVLSDGKVNSGVSPLDVAREIAGTRRVPIHTIGVGKGRVLRNYTVRELSGPRVAEVDYPLQLAGKVVISGIPGPVKASLWRTALDGGGEVNVEERELDPRGGLYETELKFVDRLPRKGRYRYRLELPRVDGEVDFGDNEKTVVVVAAEEKRRLLLVGGAPSREFQFLRTLTLRDDGIQVSCWLSGADAGYLQDGDVVIQSLPRTADALREFDVVILVDPDPADLDPTFQASVASLVVEEGSGLVFVAGEVHTRLLAASRTAQRLRSLLPVDLAAGGQLSGQEAFTTPWRPLPSPQGAQHPTCRLADDPAASRKLWASLPPFFFSVPSGALRPAAVALLERAGGPAYAAIHRVGLGEVLYFAGDNQWRWRAASVEIYERFWAGIVRYLAAGRQRAGDREAIVETDRDRYGEGDRVLISVRAFEGRRRPLEAPRLEVAVEREAGPASSAAPGVPESDAASTRSVVTLSPETGQPGHFRGVFVADKAGKYRIRVEPSGDASFTVERRSSELDDPAPDFELLEALARQSDGRFLPLEEAADLPDLVPRTEVTEILGQRAAMVWDSAALMAIFSALLVLEWVLRKLWRLN